MNHEPGVEPQALLAPRPVRPDGAAEERPNRPVWQAIEFDFAEAVIAVESQRVRWPDSVGIGLVGPQPRGHETDYRIRILAPRASSGMSENPITGSLNAASPAGCTARAASPPRSWWPRTPDGDTIWIGGEAQVLIEGTLEL